MILSSSTKILGIMMLSLLCISFVSALDPVVNISVVPAIFNSENSTTVNILYTHTPPNSGNVYIEWRVNNILVNRTNQTGIAINTNASFTLGKGNYSHHDLLNVTVWAESSGSSLNKSIQQYVYPLLVPNHFNLSCSAEDENISCAFNFSDIHFNITQLYLNGSNIANLSNSTNSFLVQGLIYNFNYNITLYTIDFKNNRSSGLTLFVETESEEPLCQNIYGSKLFLENARPFQDVNKSFTFYIYYLYLNDTPILDNKPTNHVDLHVYYNNSVLDLHHNNVTYYDSINKRWFITMLSSVVDDTNFTIRAESDHYACKEVKFLTKWRIPFYVNFQLYKEALNSTDPHAYMNDFQYVVLTNKNDVRTLDMTAISFNNGAYGLINGLFSWTSAKPVSISSLPPDVNTYFWGNYGMGDAQVKLYEPGNYSVYVMNNKVQYPSNYFWEFQRPTTNDPGYLGNIYDDLEVYDHTNMSNTYNSLNNSVFKISLSRFEANGYFATLNLLYVVLIIIVYVGLTILIIYIAGDSLNGWRIILGWLLAGGSIAVGLIYSLPH
jgi:hypothetical protein